MQASVTQSTLRPKMIDAKFHTAFLWGLADGQSWENTISLGMIWFAGKSLRSYEQGFMLGRQALKRRERMN